ncbi:MAG: hemolysin III family protein [Victivallaceae bacterium]|nr:hemolysin III family protein [Victivallaceae bacterium]
MEEIKYYHRSEERFNITSHAIGLVLSIVACMFLSAHAYRYGNIFDLISFNIFGMSLTVLYAASTVYHSTKQPALRGKLRVIDHAAIYVLIAGTYTPFTLITLNGKIGWTICAASWSMAFIGKRQIEPSMK